MEAQSHGQHHYYEDEDLQYYDEGEQNQHEEKKSVLKKVKDKTKKIKDTIKKHRHGDDQIPEEEDEEEEDEDLGHAPEIHGAPMYVSPVIPGTSLPVQTDVNLEHPAGTREDRYSLNPNVGGGEVIRPPRPVKMETDMGRSSVEACKPGFENILQSSPDATSTVEASVEEPMVQISPLIGLEEDPHSPKIHPAKSPSNYQSKVTDPTGEGGKEAEVAPLLQRLDNFHIRDESQPNPGLEQKPYTGSHDQFSPQSTPTLEQFTPESNSVNLSKNSEPPGGLDRAAKPESMPRDTVAEKISSTTSAITDKAVSAKDMVASKLGYGGQSQHGDVSSKKPVTGLASEYGHKVGEKLAPLYENVCGAGSAVISRFQGGGEAESGEAVAEGNDRGVSVKEYLAEKLRPGEEDKALLEAISDRFYKKKEGMQGKEVEVQPAGRDMEPGEVAARESKEATSSEKSGGGVVDRLKVTVGSWLGKSSGAGSAHHSLGQSDGSVPGVRVVQSKDETRSQQPKLQQSGN